MAGRGWNQHALPGSRVGGQYGSHSKKIVTAQVRIGRSRRPQGGEPVFGVLGQGLDDVPTLLFSGRYE
jgi:hypothetical protein